MTAKKDIIIGIVPNLDTDENFESKEIVKALDYEFDTSEEIMVLSRHRRNSDAMDLGTILEISLNATAVAIAVRGLFKYLLASKKGNITVSINGANISASNIDKNTLKEVLKKAIEANINKEELLKSIKADK